MFVDRHNLTLSLSTFCGENGIELIQLYPNSTHLLQPMDVCVFRPMKLFWKKAVRKFRFQNDGKKMKIEDFAPVFQDTLRNISPDTIRNGFRRCGLVPFTFENVKLFEDEGVVQKKEGNITPPRNCV